MRQRYEEESLYLNLPQNSELDQYFSPKEKARIKNVTDYQAEMADDILNPKSSTGLFLPWKKAVDFKVRPGEVTLHSGFNGAKKSMVLGLMQLGFMAQEEKTLTISLEMSPKTTLHRMMRQYCGTGQIGVDEQTAFFEFAKGRMFIYDQLGTVQWKRIISVCRYAATLGVTQIIVDSLMKCGVRSKDLETQAEFLDQLCAVAKDCQLHIHLVAHAKKPTQDHGDKKPPTKYDIAGSGDLSNQADNVMIHFSNPDPLGSYAQMVIISKQRNPETDNSEPSYIFGFDNGSLQLTDNGAVMFPTDWQEQLWT